MLSGIQKSKDKYLKEKVDTFVLRVPKGEKDAIKTYASSLGKSLNSYIVDLIKKDMSLTEHNSESKKTSNDNPEKTLRKNSLPDFFD